MSTPSSSIAPASGGRSRARTPRSVDLPDAFAPMIIVIRPGAIARSSPSITVRPGIAGVEPADDELGRGDGGAHR